MTNLCRQPSSARRHALAAAGNKRDRTRLSLTGALLLLTACDAEPVYLGPATLPGADAVAIAEGGIPVPFAVDDHYAPSGVIDDQGGIQIEADGCGARPRPPAAVGHCYRVEFSPKEREGELFGTSSWATVFFQYPENNWGAEPGLTIAPGATAVVLSAAGEQGGEEVTFLAGGIVDPSLPNSDELNEAAIATLTTSWQEFRIDLSRANYHDVISAFGIHISSVPQPEDANPLAPVVFYVDNIHWE